ncbi:MAG TPA: ribonuclease R [Bacilli bacterium]|nr:ribonuclease R [Bacilli bacterium]
MEERIIEIVKTSDRALSVDEIFHALNLKSTEDLKELMVILNQMEDNLQLYRTKKDNYMPFSNSNLKVGKLIGNKKGFGFVDIEGADDVFIPPMNMNNAIHGDKVIVEITSKKGTNMEGRILKILERSFDTMVGEYVIKDNKGTIILDNDKIKLNIFIDKDKSMGAMEGHKVLVKMGAKLKDNNYKGEIIRILGHKNDPGVDILSVMAKYGINSGFSDEVMKEALETPNEVTKSDIEGRRDLTNEMIFTIDGDDTKDIDDAISIEKLKDGGFKLGVHIADVSYYVKEGSKLDDEAYDRGTSVYLADRVEPMYPHKLSNGICSLNPMVDRLAISCVMEINSKGEVVSPEIFESVIRSRKQMTYKNVNKILEENTIPEGYEEYADTLRMMKECADLLRKNKNNRGYIDFDIDELKLIIDAEGKVTDIKKRERGVGEKLIEDFMIAANEAVATTIYFMELPFVYRVHGLPSEEKIQNFLKFIGVLGYKVDGNIKNITPRAMQQILEQLKDKKEFHILSSVLLRSMQKAVYDKVNIGHFGLASKCYTHFTSPIRRYPDTTVHRLLRKYLFQHKMDKDTINYWDNKLVLLTEHSSYKEKMSVECEREVDDMKVAEYMADHIGEEYTGIVSSVVSFGLFIELPNLIEGLVKIDSLSDDKYIYDETTFSLTGQKHKKIYRLGDDVRIKVVGASKEARTVDFEIIEKDSQVNN